MLLLPLSLLLHLHVEWPLGDDFRAFTPFNDLLMKVDLRSTAIVVTACDVDLAHVQVEHALLCLQVPVEILWLLQLHLNSLTSRRLRVENANQRVVLRLLLAARETGMGRNHVKG